MSTTLLAAVLDAQTHNSMLAGDELIRAARSVANILQREDLVALSYDNAGERILGAALLMNPILKLADRSCRLDGAQVLLVCGYISGDAGVSTHARALRALGAFHIEAALLSRWLTPIDGCDEVWCVGGERSLAPAAEA